MDEELGLAPGGDKRIKPVATHYPADGHRVGRVACALIIAILSNGLILVGVSDIWQFIIKGLVIIGAVALDRYRLKGSART